MLRARETAEEICRAFDCEPEADDRLAPGASADAVRAAVAGRGDEVVVVGHQPDCGRITAEVAGGPEPASTSFGTPRPRAASPTTFGR